MNRGGRHRIQHCMITVSFTFQYNLQTMYVYTCGNMCMCMEGTWEQTNTYLNIYMRVCVCVRNYIQEYTEKFSDYPRKNSNIFGF